MTSQFCGMWAWRLLANQMTSSTRLKVLESHTTRHSSQVFRDSVRKTDSDTYRRGISSTIRGKIRFNEMAKGKKWVLLKPFEGTPKRSDVEIQEFDIPAIKDGEVLLETAVLSVDPYQRLTSQPGKTMDGEIVAKVIESEDTAVSEGDYVVARTGWVTHAVIPGKDTLKAPPFPKGVPVSLALSTFGMPGLTAYLALLEICEPKKGETVYVNAAAGAVGTIVGQLAKMRGCKVVGSVGSEAKANYLKSEIGFDEVYNYKKVTPDKLKAELEKLAPNGIDVFFESVGGEATSVVFNHMNKNGRVVVIGSISNYNSPGSTPPKVTEFLHVAVAKTLRIQGFYVFEHYGRRDEPLKQLAEWVREGKLKYKENVHTGFESMFDAFSEIFTGKNLGKSVVKV